MIENDTALRESVVGFSAKIGSDPLLTQGAGGNVSWKDGDTLWIKASGTWLADAAEKNIFVPVSLSEIVTSIEQGNFDVRPAALDGQALRPSIETTLHALMPHRIVVHVHAVEALAYLVRSSGIEQLRSRLGDSMRWTAVPYCKPGADLAKGVHLALEGCSADAVFLQNHGVVLGGDTIVEIEALLATLSSKLKTPPLPPAATAPVSELDAAGRVYHALPGASIQALALDPVRFDRLRADWALYPDHVVFLGAAAPCFDKVGEIEGAASAPDMCIVSDLGVFATAEFSNAKRAQLLCYADVLARQQPNETLQSLDMAQVSELLGWDSERYRIGLEK